MCTKPPSTIIFVEAPVFAPGSFALSETETFAISGWLPWILFGVTRKNGIDNKYETENHAYIKARLL